MGSQYFKQPVHPDNITAADQHDHGDMIIRSVGFQAVFLVLTMLPIVLLSKSMAKLVEYGITTLQAPQALGGF